MRKGVAAVSDHLEKAGCYSGLVLDPGDYGTQDSIVWQCNHEHHTQGSALVCGKQAVEYYNQLVSTGGLAGVQQ